ncbi:MAG: hypothetical protein HON53_14690 [Planctomycetaceae bacterium]|nr:hypothetical protein [Planctomycetaceae bacterium]MBT6157066.1 hypothetical protein [Planctomycetaceae bacterium]MBT6484368.1 hypothetical protein [Planctomycetaceae bacterium]
MPPVGRFQVGTTMAPNKRIREWYARVEELCSLIVKRPELTWLWEIRIKILMYLIQRYGESDPEPTPPARPRPASFTWPKHAPGREPCTATRRKQIHTLLENIHRVNRISKTKTAC